MSEREYRLVIVGRAEERVAVGAFGSRRVCAVWDG